MTTFSSGGFWQVQGVEEVELLLGGFAGAFEGAFADMGGVFLDACEQIERGAGGLRPLINGSIRSGVI